MRYYLLVTALMLSLWYSTAGHWLSFTPESTTLLTLDVLTAQHSANGDAELYTHQTTDLNDSVGPHKYRVVMPLLVRGFVALFPMPVMLGYLVLNAIIAILTGTGFAYYLRRWHGFDGMTAALGAVLMFTSFSLQNTLLFSFLEPVSYGAALLCFDALHRRNPYWFALVGVVAVLTKEVFIVFIPCWIILEAWHVTETADYRAARAGVVRRLRRNTVSDGRRGA